MQRKEPDAVYDRLQASARFGDPSFFAWKVIVSVCQNVYFFNGNRILGKDCVTVLGIFSFRCWTAVRTCVAAVHAQKILKGLKLVNETGALTVSIDLLYCYYVRIVFFYKIADSFKTFAPADLDVITHYSQICYLQ